MAFGQQSGPPATARQVQELLTLLNDAGHSDFRDARGPMGFTQRQAAGKFTRDEADTFIEQLQTEAESPTAAPAPEPVAARPRTTSADRSLAAIPAEKLAAELQRRGWVVLEP
jgi:hypothetical protein